MIRSIPSSSSYIRVLMRRSGHLHHVDRDRLSFKGTLDTARHFADVIHATSASR